MAGYILKFIIYTCAMIGCLLMAVIVYKKATAFSGSESKELKIDEKLSLNPRKTLYIINASGERFLIAGDIDRTALIAKLGDKNSENPSKIVQTQNISDNFTDEMSENEVDAIIARKLQQTEENAIDVNDIEIIENEEIKNNSGNVINWEIIKSKSNNYANYQYERSINPHIDNVDDTAFNKNILAEKKGAMFKELAKRLKG